MAFNYANLGSCCVAKVIDDWKGTEEEDTFYSTYNQSVFEVSDYESYKVFATNELKGFCKKNNDQERGKATNGNNEYDDMRNLAVFAATLRSDQVWALQFAKEVGFTRTRPLVKGRYNRDAEMRLLWIASADLFAWYEGVK